MKFNSLTSNISIGILGITALYTLIYGGLTGLLLCSSVTLIAAAFLDQLELIVAVSVVFALFYIYFLKGYLRKIEPFGSFNDGSQAIVSRVAGMQDKYHQVPQNLKDYRREPAGVYDPAVEGFEDVQQFHGVPFQMAICLSEVRSAQFGLAWMSSICPWIVAGFGWWRGIFIAVNFFSIFWVTD